MTELIGHRPARVVGDSL